MFSIFKNNNSTCNFYSPVDGELCDLSQVQDNVFSQKLMGDGFAILPKNGVVLSPVNGRVEMLRGSSSHVVGLKSDEGLELLIHVGLCKDELEVNCFNLLVNLADEVKHGQELLTFDLDFFKKNDLNSTVVVVVTDDNGFVMNDIIENKEVAANELVCSYVNK